MVKSKFIADVMNLLLEGNREALLAKQQLPFILEHRFDYSGAGVFIHLFGRSTKIEAHD